MIISVTPKDSEWVAELMENLVKTFPDSGGMITPEVSVKKQLEIIEGCTIQDNGAYLSI